MSDKEASMSVSSAWPEMLTPFQPQQVDHASIMATLARIEAKLDQLLAAKEDGT